MNKTYPYRYKDRLACWLLLLGGVIMVFVRPGVITASLIILSIYGLLSKGTISISDDAITIRYDRKCDKIVIKEITMIACGDSFDINAGKMYKIEGQRLSKEDYLEIEEYLNMLKVIYNV